ncbi:HHL235Cp [Eremothecium sinecaudum]|uniref:HHL235Cp n=1 Tax=Eremothecium sinecaudum TaxID=45286 RepID=A0A0X8HW73_9SACH|nr:HHL235Cp [Eremothecium sinecaudum]AMD22535.1 HHL235Cp [Eremothecium sinecaudum]
MDSNQASSDAKASLDELENKGLLATAGVVVPEMAAAAVAAAAAAGVGGGNTMENHGGGQQGAASMQAMARSQYQQALQDSGAGGATPGNMTPTTAGHGGMGSGSSGSSQPPMIQLPSMSMPSLMYQLSHHHPSTLHHAGIPQMSVLKQNGQQNGQQQGQQQSQQDDMNGGTSGLTNGGVGLPMLSATSSSQGIQAIQLNEGEHINSHGQLIGRSGKPLRNTKRAAQNRNAQKAFRQRREKYIKDLETKAKHYDELTQELLELKRENDELKLRLTELEKLA